MPLTRHERISPDELRTRLDRIAFDNLAVKVGVADLIPLLERYPDLLDKLGNRNVIRAYVLAIRLSRGVLATIEGMPNALYLHNYRQVNYQLDTLALALADCIERAGYTAVPVAASQVVSKKPMLGHVSHRLLAQWAGLGWRGRNHLLVTKEFGSQIRLVSVVTNAPLTPSTPMLVAACGSCHACVDACPAHALGDSFEDYDLRACYDKLTEFSSIPFVSQHICGICQRMCGGELGPA
jgi:epoxyqueuosine reductase